MPGAFDAWLLLLRDFGTLSLREVLEPAIGYAQNGYPLVPGISAAISAMEPMFRNEWPGSAELYLPAPQPGKGNGGDPVEKFQKWLEDLRKQLLGGK